MPVQLTLFDLDLYTVKLPAKPEQVEKRVVKVDPQPVARQLKLDLFPQPHRGPRRKLPTKVAA